ncbi:MAG: RdgB/HAM1 family non-canonical purine NTP pyrophosphatase [Paludibacteraceae bacterium]|nr:RdgB/HAM1 family non-canonical purine NTP pyrophosphatase [Paludibacteraceae bacterium]
MKTLVFATANRHKLIEVQSFLGEGFALHCLADLGITAEIPETAGTLEGNALQKARYVYEHCHQACFADDTGLEIDALDGQPGVYSARYAGPAKDSQANMRKVLEELKGCRERSARFRTVIAYIDHEGAEHLFEGRVEGAILEAPVGGQGFGYDPIFQPEGYTQSFAQLSLAEKNTISHRARAMRAFCTYLERL